MKSSQSSGAKELQKAKDYALKYISYRSRTVREVNRKLTDKGYDIEVITLVVAFLKEYRFLDDECFARNWVASRMGDKPCGRRRIFSELIQKGVDRSFIEDSLAGITPDLERELVVVLVEKKCRRSAFNYNKLKGFLLRRGFSPNTVSAVLADYLKNMSE